MEKHQYLLKIMKVLIKLIFVLTIVTLVIFIQLPKNINAHPGNTDGFGCHTCRTNCPDWGYDYGEYHCHNPKLPPILLYPQCQQLPKINSAVRFLSNPNGTYDVFFDWDDLYNQIDRQYSIAISKYVGADPGPLADTTVSSETFKNVLPGRWYINLKAELNGYWSCIENFLIDVPSWVPPIPSPSPQIKTVVPSYDIPKEGGFDWVIWIILAVVGAGIYGLIISKKEEK